MMFLANVITVVVAMIVLYVVLWVIDQRLHARKKSKQRGFRHD
jgi:hypothetical protein